MRTRKTLTGYEYLLGDKVAIKSHDTQKNTSIFQMPTVIYVQKQWG